MKTHRVDTYAAVEDALKQRDLKQSLYDEGGILMDKVLVTLHGNEHRHRRAVESQVFRRNFFRYYEDEVFPKLLSETLNQFLNESEIDLKSLGYRIMVHLSLSFAGIDRIDGSVEEADAQHRLLIQLGQAATIGQYKGERQKILDEISDALREFEDRFFAPSRERRLNLIQEFKDGEIEEESLPRDILTILLMNEDVLEMPHELLVREVAFFYLASSHTSVHTMVHAVHEIFTSYSANLNELVNLVNDPILLQRFVLESIRLHPSSPEAWRRAEQRVILANNQIVEQGEKVVIDLQTANRDITVFGSDADQFNPMRERRRRLSPAGMSFGGGMHACLGMNLVAGTVLVNDEDYDSENHEFGTITLIIRELLARGMRPHPEKSPEKIEASERDVWKIYPVQFT